MAIRVGTLIVIMCIIAAIDVQGIGASSTYYDLAAKDFGGIVSVRPLAFLAISKSDDLARIVRLAYISDDLTVAARGNGHSINGQAMAEGGLVIDMRSVESGHFGLVKANGSTYYADVPGGALWEDVLDWCLAQGLSPRSNTDYLRLTVGGTLSNAGVGGHTFRFGPQTSNVAELEVITGKGQRVVCSEKENAELFFGALGGLGQFGIITRAQILLQPAPDMVRWIRLVYTDFDEFTQDAESLVTAPEGQSFDYIEGIVVVNGDDPFNGWPSVPLHPNQTFNSDLIPQSAGPMLYCLEVTLHYKKYDSRTAIDVTVDSLLRQLRYVEGLDFQADVSYRDFLLRVKWEEQAARAEGAWDKPHRWLNIFLSRTDIAEFDHAAFKTILKDGIGGRLLVYPVLRRNFDNRTSLVLPEAEIFYIVSILRLGLPIPNEPSVGRMISQDKEIIKVCEDNAFDYKLYLWNFETQEEWKRHFGKKWGMFARRKMMFDPKAILSPGQNIFT
ncbi:cytokinin dehydrogenase 7-like [Punica granatum]|uniref:cytokinin dehydrogenase n=1 Tax=Punica granatum TaxID=22663 RepID=A0A6P8CXR1_PUNGR|nr:cytokinin dehydrogenase 7-like [Punica granatum]